MCDNSASWRALRRACTYAASATISAATATTHSVIPVYLPPMAARRKTVLVIDANEESRERLSQTLRRDYRVIRAASVESGLAVMDKDEVDVLVADMQQPGLGGIALLQIVRENFPLVEIIMTSAAPDVDGAVRAIKLGAYHFL